MMMAGVTVTTGITTGMTAMTMMIVNTVTAITAEASFHP